MVRPPKLPRVFSALPLRFVLVIPFVLQITAAVSLTGWLSIRNGQKAVHDVVLQLREKVSNRIDQKLNEFLTTPHLVNQINQDAIELGYVDLQDSEALYRHFYRQADHFDFVESIFFGGADGEFIGTTHFNQGRNQLMIAGRKTRGNIRFYDVDPQGKPQQMVREALNFDPRHRPWYQAALKAAEPTWGEVFTYQAYPVMALPAVSPVYSEAGEPLGVLGNNFFLSEISDFLHTLDAGKTGETFIIERSGELVASSTDQDPFHLTEEGTQRIEITHTQDPLLRASGQFLINKYGNYASITQPAQLDFVLEQERYFLSITPYQDQRGLEWLVGIVIPESDFMAQIHTNTRTTILLCFGSLILATGIGIVTARQITQPLLQLNQAAKKTAQGNWQQTNIPPRPLEVQELAHAFNQMTVQLQASFRQMQSLNEALAKNENRLYQFLDALPVGVAVHDLTGQIIYINRVGKQLVGMQQLSATPGRNITLTYQMYEASTGNPCPTDQLPGIVALRGEAIYVNDLVIHRGTQVIPIEAWANPIFDDQAQVTYAIVAFQDITNRKRAEEQLLHNAFHDALTDLPNRNFLMQRLEVAMNRVKDKHCFAVLFLDLDHFKMVNDSLGHFVGDQLLMVIAQKLQQATPASSLVARLGGDEFVILLEDIAAVNDAITVAQKIFTAFQAPLQLEGRTIFVSTSIGIVMGDAHYQEAAELLRNADIAMYRAKAKGRARYEVFDEAMHTQVLQRLTLENDLRRAIEQQEFMVYYQPIVTLETQALVGFEALLRWQHPQCGLVSPSQFIPIAEEKGLIIPISRWLLQTVCQQLATWQRQFPEPLGLKVSMNLSGYDLQDPYLLNDVDQALANTGLTGHLLTLEITEGMLIESFTTAVELLKKLQQRGIQISIDDFGTGYSSLSYLYHLPVNSLKIDRSFVNSMELGSCNYKIVETIIALSHHLGINAIAEGIETAQQLVWLQQLGCKLGQGYLFAHPLPADVATVLIAQDFVKL